MTEQVAEAPRNPNFVTRHSRMASTSAALAAVALMTAPIVEASGGYSSEAIKGSLRFQQQDSEPDERYFELPEWRCDVQRGIGPLKDRTIETDLLVKPEVAIGDGVMAVTYQKTDLAEDEDAPPRFATRIFPIVEQGVVVNFFSEDCPAPREE
jgi:hypothetical protein